MDTSREFQSFGRRTSASIYAALPPARRCAPFSRNMEAWVNVGAGSVGVSRNDWHVIVASGATHISTMVLQMIPRAEFLHVGMQIACLRGRLVCRA